MPIVPFLGTRLFRACLATGDQKPAYDWPAPRFSQDAQWPQSRAVQRFLLATARPGAHRLSRLICPDFSATAARAHWLFEERERPSGWLTLCGCAGADFLEEAELRPSPAGKEVGTVSGDSRSQALPLPGQRALGKNRTVLESFRFVAAVTVTVSSGGGGAGGLPSAVSDRQGSWPMGTGASKMGPEIGPF